jgi:hypothetical protein
VGLLGEDAVLSAFFIGARDGFELGFYRCFVSGGGGREAEDGLGVRGAEWRECDESEQGDQVFLVRGCLAAHSHHMLTGAVRVEHMLSS